MPACGICKLAAAHAGARWRRPAPSTSPPPHPTLTLTPTPVPPPAQSITALAHLRAAVLYVVDISEQCGYTLAQQAQLFHSIKPLFANKPVRAAALRVCLCGFVWLRLPAAGWATAAGSVAWRQGRRRRRATPTALAPPRALPLCPRQVLIVANKTDVVKLEDLAGGCWCLWVLVLWQL